MKTQQILAVDIGGSKIMAGIAHVPVNEKNLEQKGVDFFRSIERKSLTPDCHKEQLLHELHGLITQLGPFDAIEAAGINVPGLADPKTGLWIYAPFSGISDLPIANLFADWTGITTVAVENDVNACAYAEKLFGGAKGIDDFLWVTISNGIGGGWVLNGDIYRGHFGNAGEFGHLVVTDEGGMRCGCGHYGCLEAEAAGPGIARRYFARTGTQKTAAEMADLARKGDVVAKEVFECTARLIGKGMSYAANLINPAKIFVGGGVSGAFDLLQPLMLETMHAGSLELANKKVNIEKTALGYEAALLGATAMGLRAINSQSLTSTISAPNSSWARRTIG